MLQQQHEFKYSKFLYDINCMQESLGLSRYTCMTAVTLKSHSSRTFLL